MTVDANFRKLRKQLEARAKGALTMSRASLPSKGAGDTLVNNENRIYFAGTGDDAGYIYMSSGNDLSIGNFADGEKIILIGKDSGGTQREIAFSVEPITSVAQLVVEDGLRLVAVGATSPILLIAPGDITIESDSDLYLIPDGDIFVTSYQRHIQIPALLTGNPSNQPTSVDFFTAGGLQFATSGTKYAFCQWELPDDWDGGDVYFEVDWFPGATTKTSPAAVKWDVEYAAVAEGEVHGAASKTVTVTHTSTAAQYLSVHSRVTLAYNDATQPLTKQDHIYFKISRDTGVANDFSSTVTVPAFEIIYNSVQIPRGN